MDLPKGFYGIVDHRFGCIESAKKLIDFGSVMIQYRCKNKADREILKEAETIRKLTADNGVIFIINDRVDVALIVGADGVHVGDEDMPPCRIREIVPENFIIGLSTHSVEEVKNAQCCDYIGVGPVFPTTTKNDPHPVVGVDLAREMVLVSKYPAYLIGGITLDNIKHIKGIPAHGFVSIRDVLSNDRRHFERMMAIWNS